MVSTYVCTLLATYVGDNVPTWQGTYVRACRSRFFGRFDCEASLLFGYLADKPTLRIE
jgi:hypothetical protein